MTDPAPAAEPLRLHYCPLCLGWQVDYADSALADLDERDRNILVEGLVKEHLGDCPEVVAFLARGGADRNPSRPLKARVASRAAGVLTKAVERVERLAS